MMSESRRVFAATEAEVGSFAALSQDKNPLHVDSEYAEDGFFGERVVHGVFTLGWLSAVLAELPADGDVILTGLREVDFQNPVYFNEPVEVSVEWEYLSQDRMDFTIKSVETDEVKTTGQVRTYITKSGT